MLALAERESEVGKVLGYELYSEVEDGCANRDGEREGVEKHEYVEDEVSSVRVDEDEGEGESCAG